MKIFIYIFYINYHRSYYIEFYMYTYPKINEQKLVYGDIIGLAELVVYV